MKFHVLMPTLLILVLAFALFGCSDDATTDTTPTTIPDGSAMGQLKLLLVDAPVDFDDVVLDVRSVSVHRSAADSLDGWYDVAVEPAAIHLLDLTNGVTALLADADLAAGHYNEIRLLLGDGNIVVVDGESFDLRVPSGSHSGLKIHHDFEILEDMPYEAIIDIDVARSVHRMGHMGYVLRPMIRAHATSSVGCIAGVVEPLAAEAMVWTVAGDDTVQTFTDGLTGAFRLMALPEGVYDVFVTPQVGGWLATDVAGVEVSARQVTDLGTIVLEADGE